MTFIDRKFYEMTFHRKYFMDILLTGHFIVWYKRIDSLPQALNFKFLYLCNPVLS